MPQIVFSLTKKSIRLIDELADRHYLTYDCAVKEFSTKQMQECNTAVNNAGRAFDQYANPLVINLSLRCLQ